VSADELLDRKRLPICNFGCVKIDSLLVRLINILCIVHKMVHELVKG
jgi:hypothetical protein